MSAIRLLVLGAVRQHGRAHGYQVRNDLEYWGAHEWSNAKPGSIYHALKQMAKQGLLHAHETAPSTAGGPPRTEYEITEAGNEEFYALLRAALVGRSGSLMRPGESSAAAEAGWARELTEKIESGAYTFGGAGEPFVAARAAGQESPYGPGEPHPGDAR